MTHLAGTRWFLDRKGAVSGPYTLTELYRLLEIGEAGSDDRVQAEGTREWSSLATVFRDKGGSSASNPTAAATAAGKPAPPPRGNYFVRHWRGDLSLGVSYWLNLFLLSIVVMFALRLAGDLGLAANFRPLEAALLLTAVLALTAVLYIWQLVGTWRSSDKHVSRGGNKGWAITAKVVLCLGILRSITEFGNSGITVANAWRHFSLMSELPPTRFLALRSGSELELVGGIHAGSAGALRVALEQAPRARVLHLNSPGGDVSEAHEMAALVRARGMDTYVRGRCLSACTTIFLAGRSRLLREGGQLGFHEPTVVAAGRDGDWVVNRERRSLVSAGVPEWFATRAFSARGNEMWFPTTAELTSARVVTAVTDGRHLSPGRPDPLASRDTIQATLRTNPMAAAVERVNPAVFRDMVDRTVAIINDGGTADEGTQAIETAAAPLLTEALKVLPDRQLSAAVRLIAETARHIGAQDARMCQDWLIQRPGQPMPIITRLLTPEQRQAIVQMSADAIISAADPRLRVSAPTQEPPQLQAVIRRLQARLPQAQFAALAATPGTTHAPAAVCSASIELFMEILRLPEREAGALLRFMMSNS